MVPILLQELEFERIRDLVRGHPRFGLRLEAADHQAADLLLEVGVAVGISQDRQIGMHAGDVLADDVEVLGGVQRHVDPRHGADLLGPLARAVDDDLGLDVTGVGPHTRSASRPSVDDVEHPDLLDHDGAAHAGALGQGEGQIGRVGLAVGGQPDGADEVVDPHDRIVLQRLFGGEQFAFHVERGGAGRGAAQLRHAVLGARHGNPAAPLVACRKSGFPFEFGVELGGVLHESGEALRGPQLSDQPGRVPGGARGELALFEQHDVGDAEFGEVVGDAGADHPTADDRRPERGPAGVWWP